jgi:hypothetical protein
MIAIAGAPDWKNKLVATRDLISTSVAVIDADAGKMGLQRLRR